MHQMRKQPGFTPAWSFPAVLLGVAVVIAAAYLAGVVLPYYVNDLDRIPPWELTSGAYDPKDLWPPPSVAGQLL